MTDSKQKRLQSLDQDVVSVPSTSSRQVSGSDTGSKGDSVLPSGRSAGGSLMLILLAITMLLALAVGAMILINVQQRIDSLQTQVGALKPAVDVASLQAQSSFLEGQLMLLHERLDRLEEAPLAAASSSRSDSSGHVALSEVNARVRKLDIENGRLKVTVDGLTDKLTALQSRTQRIESWTSSQREVLAQQSSAQEQQQDELDQAAQLEEMDSQLKRLNNDIRSIYRMLEMGR